jgi:hypothetical protein
LPAARQLVGECDGIDLLAVFVQFAHGEKNAFVSFGAKVGRREHGGDLGERGLIMRIDRAGAALGSGKPIVAVAAVIGRPYWQGACELAQQLGECRCGRQNTVFGEAFRNHAQKKTVFDSSTFSLPTHITVSDAGPLDVDFAPAMWAGHRAAVTSQVPGGLPGGGPRIGG